jgi:hypothetical protein
MMITPQVSYCDRSILVILLLLFWVLRADGALWVSGCNTTAVTKMQQLNLAEVCKPVNTHLMSTFIPLVGFIALTTFSINKQKDTRIYEIIIIMILPTNLLSSASSCLDICVKESVPTNYPFPSLSHPLTNLRYSLMTPFSLLLNWLNTNPIGDRQ